MLQQVIVVSMSLTLGVSLANDTKVLFLNRPSEQTYQPVNLDHSGEESIGSYSRVAASPLLDQLTSAPDELTAQDLENRIMKTWIVSGSPEIDALMQQSMVYAQEGNLDAALAVQDAVITKAPGFAEGWNQRATLLYLLGHYDVALADLGRVLAIEPRHFAAASNIGLICAARGDHLGAVLAFERVLEIDPLNKIARSSIRELRKQLEGAPV